jgi:hypothetical protein
MGRTKVVATLDVLALLSRHALGSDASRKGHRRRPCRPIPARLSLQVPVDSRGRTLLADLEPCISPAAEPFGDVAIGLCI